MNDLVQEDTVNETEKKIVSDLIDLCLSMGSVIRELDEGNYSELWTHDAEYIQDQRYMAACHLIGRPETNPE